MPQPDGERQISVLVVDDEPLSRRNLVLLLRSHADIASVTECDGGNRAVDEIRSIRPDLVFLDVQMPECNGFDVLELLGMELPPAIVFVTAHDAHALRAFEFGALDYLLKPVDEARFLRALQRARGRIAQHDGGAWAAPARFVVKSHGRVRFVTVADIDWIEAADYYAQLHLAQESHLLRKSLSELEAELVPRGFCRIHRSIIVNVGRVRSLELRADGEYDAVLGSGARLRVSRTFRRSIQERLARSVIPSGGER